MSVYTKQEVVETFPAYDIVERDVDREGFVNITYADRLGLKGNGYYSEFRPGSVVSYALQYNEDPIAAVENAKARGHDLHWINACAAVLTNHKQERQTLVKVTLGMKVRFEGLLATIEPDRNDNLKFKPIEG